MVQAAASGVVNFREAKLLDVNWWRRLRLLLAQLEDENHRQCIAAAHQHHLAFCQVPGLLEQNYDAHASKANTALGDLIDAYFPWRTSARKAETMKLRDAWAEKFGDPANPTVKAAIERTAMAMLAQAEENRKRAQQHRRPG